MGLGFISYDYVRRYETLPVDTVDDLETPDLFFIFSIDGRFLILKRKRFIS